MWVDNNVPNWFPTLKNFYRSPFWLILKVCHVIAFSITWYNFHYKNRLAQAIFLSMGRRTIHIREGGQLCQWHLQFNFCCSKSSVQKTIFFLFKRWFFSFFTMNRIKTSFLALETTLLRTDKLNADLACLFLTEAVKCYDTRIPTG
jgi:hypothetical protein